MATENKDFKVKNGLVVGEGGTFGGTVSVATPTSNTHATTKLYVDDLIAGVGGGSITVSDTAPTSPTEGDLWYNSLDGSTYVFYDSFWVESSSAYAGPTGATGMVLATSPLSFDEATSTLSIDLNAYATLLDIAVKKTEVNEALSSDITLVAGHRYFIDTTAARILTLPANPSLGDEVTLFDASNLAATNNVTVNNNGQNIEGLLEGVLLDVNAFVISFVYTGTTYGWRMI